MIEDYKEYDRILSEVEIDEDCVYDAPRKDFSLAEEVKFSCCTVLINAKETLGLTGVGFAKILGCNKADFSRITHYKISKFSSDKLFSYIQNCYLHLQQNQIHLEQDGLKELLDILCSVQRAS